MEQDGGVPAGPSSGWHVADDGARLPRGDPQVSRRPHARNNDDLERDTHAMTDPLHFNAAQLAEHLTDRAALSAVRHALLGSVDPAATLPAARTRVDHGTVLFSPAAGDGFVAARVTGEADDADRATGIVLLLDAQTLAPAATIDGAALAFIRDAAVSATAVDALSGRAASRLVVFGSGPQAKAHIRAIKQVRPIEHVVIAAANGYKAEGLAAWAVEQGLQARISQALPIGSAIPEADIVVVTDDDPLEQVPVFRGSLLRDGALVVTVGDRAERLDGELFERAQVVHEAPIAALGAGGDVAAAVDAGRLQRERLVSLREVVRGEVRPQTAAPRLFASLGLPWADLAIAASLLAAAPQRRLVSYGGIGRSSRRR